MSERIFDATKRGDLEIVKQEIENKVDINAKDRIEMTPLLYASKYGHKDIVALLIENGAFTDHEALINIATMKAWNDDKGGEFKETIKLLVDNGIDINGKDEYEWTALMYASSSGLEDKNLTHYGTYPRSPKMNAHNERFNKTLQEQFVDYNDDLLFTDIDEFNEEMANWLIDYNTKIPHHSLQMKTPVQYLLQNNPQYHMLWTNTFSGSS